ncbi:MAG: acyl-ACP--UDP-N-acetylglucosamine O-acyltransferase, partial [Parafilimonas sp.]
MIHPHTYIHHNAKLADNVKIDPFTVIHQDVEIGEGTWVASNVTIMAGTKIGSNCRIFPCAVLGAIPQDLKFDGEKTHVEIGNNTTVRECVTINRGTNDRGKTKVANNCLIMAYAHIAHDCLIADNCIISNSTQLAGHVTMDEYAIIGGVSAVHQFVHIG